MASNTTAADAGLPPDLFDQTTLVSLASTVLILAVAYGTSLKALSPSTPGSYRFLFIWHAFDALIHFFLEGSFLYHASSSPPPPKTASSRPNPLTIAPRPSASSARSPTTASPWATSAPAATTRPSRATSAMTTASGARRPLPPTIPSRSCGWSTRARTRGGPVRIRYAPEYYTRICLRVLTALFWTRR